MPRRRCRGCPSSRRCCSARCPTGRVPPRPASPIRCCPRPKPPAVGRPRPCGPGDGWSSPRPGAGSP
uniref:Uncharacterized protein n=1 Tax=uncultured marine virus TaxID=186617 RepID=A0A0F7L6D8_9VIRU|nr:hypothetical protein [uncultured marine virus]